MEKKMEQEFSNKTASSPVVETMHTPLLILGSGPAGFSAALYAARAELHPVVLTGIELGGQAALTYTIENYPGFPDGVGGSQLGDLFQKQAEKFGARVEFGTATAVDFSRRPFRVSADNGTEYQANALILATGASSKKLDVPGEKELTGKGVSYCATCDGWFFKDKNVAVVGGGDSALEEALFLTRYAASVTIIHRRDALRAGAILQKRAQEDPKIKFLWNTIVTAVEGEGSMNALRLKNVETQEETSAPFDGVFIFIGHTPNSSLYSGQVKMDSHGYVVVDHLMQTSVPGVYAAGELADPDNRQVVTSAGMGAAAAIQATRYLANETQKQILTVS
jgi:thioredoxin reductase (NADPH)